MIIGYRANEAGIVYLLVLAGENFGRLQHVGQVVPQLPVRELKALGDQLSTYKTLTPSSVSRWTMSFGWNPKLPVA